LLFGGADTESSYGLAEVGSKTDAEDLTDLSMDLEAAMPDGLLAWMRALPLSYENGNIICVHAAMSPRKPL
jgi:serine/threonine protein phosphatase 1